MPADARTMCHCREQAEDGGNQQVAGARIILRQDRKPDGEHDAHRADGGQQVVERADRVLLLFDVGRRRERRRAVAGPDAEHRADEQRQQQQENEAYGVRCHDSTRADFRDKRHRSRGAAAAAGGRFLR